MLHHLRFVVNECNVSQSMENVSWEYCKEETAIARVKWSCKFTRTASKRRQLLVKTI